MSSSGTTSRCANALFSALTETNVSTHAVVAPSVAFFAEQPPDAEDDEAEPNNDGHLPCSEHSEHSERSGPSPSNSPSKRTAWQMKNTRSSSKSSSLSKPAVRFEFDSMSPSHPVATESGKGIPETSEIILKLEHIRAELAAIRLEMAMFRNEVSGLHTDMSEMRADIGTLYSLLTDDAVE
ncbi:hypothetical protein BS47DRAFT_1386962 [Hydnum rufescens UP504]|uniref:Uncharacterized protein n=1 Tax=Hydnum rufescens UP504 TaxID=1448309 RepID=A0A9P6BAJ4_9AGAM|nr:hypothetical protein BS47DRAFT_1386962 [Hydnum rufescens UP504]